MCSPRETIDIPSLVGHVESQADHPLARSRQGPAQLTPHPCARAGSAPLEVGVPLAGGSERLWAPAEVGVPLAGGVSRAGTAVRVRSSSERPDTAAATRPESCQESAKFGPQLKARDGDIVEIVVTPSEGRPTLRAAYFFSGESHRSSVGEKLKAPAIAKNCGLIVHEIDILNGASQHDLLDSEVQSRWEARIESGEFDLTVLSPLCSCWTRSLFQPGGPVPCRDKAHPWGLPSRRSRFANEPEMATSSSTSLSAPRKRPFVLRNAWELTCAS